MWHIYSTPSPRAHQTSLTLIQHNSCAQSQQFLMPAWPPAKLLPAQTGNQLAGDCHKCVGNIMSCPSSLEEISLSFKIRRPLTLETVWAKLPSKCNVTYIPVQNKTLRRAASKMPPLPSSPLQAQGKQKITAWKFFKCFVG